MKVLIVEDDPNLAQLVKKSLIAKNYAVDIASDGSDGSFLGKMYDYDVIMLDYSLPKKDGLAVCKEIRSAGRTTPIIFLSVIDDLKVKVSALNQGADDYLVKPFELEELHARLEALLRRPRIKVPKSVLKAGDIVMDLNKRSVTRGKTEIRLTRKEFGVLEYLMRNKGNPVSRVLIMEHVWTADSDIFSNTVETHMRNLRKKLNVANKPDLISNIIGRGYMITA
jgi:two-component system OmpR family response regulator